jgi:hypothetical protein
MCFWLWRPGTASSGSGGVQASFLAMAARRPEDERACASCKDKARVDVEVTGCKINQNTVYLCKGMKGYYNEKTWFEKGTLAKPVSTRAIWRSPRLMRVNGQITPHGPPPKPSSLANLSHRVHSRWRGRRRGSGCWWWAAAATWASTSSRRPPPSTASTSLSPTTAPPRRSRSSRRSPPSAHSAPTSAPATASRRSPRPLARYIRVRIPTAALCLHTNLCSYYWFYYISSPISTSRAF